MRSRGLRYCPSGRRLRTWFTTTPGTPLCSSLRSNSCSPIGKSSPRRYRSKLQTPLLHGRGAAHRHRPEPCHARDRLQESRRARLGCRSYGGRRPGAAVFGRFFRHGGLQTLPVQHARRSQGYRRDEARAPPGREVSYCSWTTLKLLLRCGWLCSGCWNRSRGGFHARTCCAGR